MKNYLLFPLLLCGNLAFAQLNELFSDGNFTSNPVWTGSNAGNDFSIDTSGTIQLKSKSTTASSNFYLSTASGLASNCIWEFSVNLLFNPSGANYVDVYLTSDQANLQATNINGYFVRLGGINDEICLFKRSGSAASSVKLVDGVNGILNTSDNRIKIKVTRTSAHGFTLERDLTGSGTSYVTEGTLVDSSFTTSVFFGIFIQQSTSSFHQKHWFDDFKIQPLVTDQSPPSLMSVTPIDSSRLEILFDEPMDTTSAKLLSNYSMDNGFGHPLLIKTTSDAAKFILTFEKGFITASYLLTASNITDKAGNIISPANTGRFSFHKPYIAKKGDIVINEIFADPSPQIDLPSVEFIEIFNTSNQTISLQNWKYSDPASSATFPADSIKAGEHLVLCARADTNEYKRFGKTIGLSPWPSLNNSGDIIKLVSPEIQTIDSVAYSDSWYPTTAKKQGGWSLERVNPTSICSGTFNWTASTDITGGTPGKQNTAFIHNYDQLAFTADSIIQLSDTTFRFYLNKPADISTANNAFSISPAHAAIKSLSFDAFSRESTISVLGLQPNTVYQISVSAITDCAGNTISPRSFQFTTPNIPPVRLDTAKIFITEIFADPSPEVGLPLAEFVEVYNAGLDTIHLDGWTINNSPIKKASILPQGYLILCGDTTQYKTFGRTAEVSIWPGLTNASGQILLKSFKGRMIDSTSYSSAWHTNTAKKQGGWSLERIDYTSTCTGMFNWASSTDTTGGTPGVQNSIHISNYGKLALAADSIRQLSDSTITIYLNKAANVSSAANALSIVPALADIKFAFTPNLKQINLLFDKPFLSNTSYRLAISGLEDCAANRLSTEFLFKTPKAPPVRVDTAQLYITEIFADPSPEIGLPLVEFVEIYNPGKDTVNLDGYIFSNSKTKSAIRNSFILPDDYLILCPIADTVHFKPFGKVSGITSWPALLNGADQISIKSYKSRLLDSVSYLDTWHTTPVKKQGGWSLERVAYQSLCSGVFNWASSRDKSGGTPGKSNSVLISNYDKIDFKADSVKLLSDTGISVYFNKHADVSTSQDVFKISSSSAEIKVTSFDAQALKATLIFDQKLSAGTPYQLSVSNLKDCAGNIVVPTTLSFSTPKPTLTRPDTSNIYITEIFADPSPEIKLPLAEFIELYNPGIDTVDLNGWALANSKTISSLKNVFILPGQYLILCPTADTSQYKNFGQVKGVSPWPSLVNYADQLTLKSFTGRLVDTIAYFDTWHINSVKKQGGWSLERSDYRSLCGGGFNWTSSLDTDGGTPGRKNSVNVDHYDKLPFKVDSIKQTSDLTVEVTFNKHADIATSEGAFLLTPLLNMKSLSFDAKATKVIITYAEKFAANTTYQLAVNNGLRDCAGNPIASGTKLAFHTPKRPPGRLDTAKLYITEIFADPSPEVKLPLAEFVEIFNPGKDTIDVADWTFHDSSSKSTFGNAVILPQQYAILCPAADTLQYSAYGKVIGLAPWPALNNSSEQITIKSFKGRSVDSVSYKDSWYKNDVKKNGGWSLELIDKESVCTGIQNWTASIDATGGTPGRQNSVYNLFSTSEQLKVMQARLKDSATIVVSFNRPADSLFLSKSHNYKVNNGLGQPSAVSLNSAFTEVELAFSQAIKRGTSYKVSCADITDCMGRKISSQNNSSEFFYPYKISKGDILISEILFNPRDGGADFVEIYNNSDKILDLQELAVAGIKSPDSIVNKKQISTSPRFFKPKEYLVLSTNPDQIRKDYHTENPDAFLTMPSMPPFNNDAGAVVLVSKEGRIDQFSYTEKVHHYLIKEPKGVSLERTSFKIPTQNPGNFRSAAASVGFATPGYKNSQSVEIAAIGASEIELISKTFSPDNDGFEDALIINYRFKDAGMVANVSIYNDSGVLIKKLSRNTTLASEGTLVWDGTTENEQRASVGIYIIYFDLFNLNGQTKKYKKACVLASKLN
ncbi:lamin tail domain-containing protein [Paradesertivirga mongoliensis]|uniref:Lamin tail domain-containing protein n=1 Tax=Paradesertivirga mongoliensis TaxID=2100740 RepID=A0ABW4ZLM4_9SPHI|nr:lamin tail domain-containing protein [Pedobacter mongoliensis]